MTLTKDIAQLFLGAADFFCVLVQGLSGIRRAQTFFPVHCEPNATPGKTHGRHRGSPGPRTFSHFFNLILEGVYFYAAKEAKDSKIKKANEKKQKDLKDWLDTGKGIVDTGKGMI